MILLRLMSCELINFYRTLISHLVFNIDVSGETKKNHYVDRIKSVKWML